DARQEVEAILVRHHHVGDHKVAIAVRYPAPQHGGAARRPHVITGAAERLGQDCADRSVVIGDKDGLATHGQLSSLAGRRTRKMVRPPALLCSTIPPWSPMILATSGRPRPLPLDLVVTKGSKR